MIAANLELILAEISEAAKAAGRPSDAVQLVAVSKTKPVEAVQEARAAGQVHFGENRVQEMVAKQEVIPDAKWHMIGTLQRNKVKYIAPFVHLIHSIDSEKLLAEVQKQARKCNRVINVLLQLNISDEPQKGGLEEPEAASLLARMDLYPNVRVSGLMGMAEFTSDESVIAAQFARLKSAFDSFQSLESSNVQLTELSMGMSGDFPIAIAQGATLVRVGSAIFGGRST